MKDRNASWLRRWKGESLVAWLKRRIKYRLQHVRYRDVVINRETGETARWYPDHAGGVLEHRNWWSLCKPEQLDDVEGRLASNEVGYHMCMIQKPHMWKKPLLDLRYNPLSNDEDISIICPICRSYSCCRRDEHGITAVYDAILGRS